MESPSPRRRVERVRHELRRRDVQVARVEPLGSEFVRVVFQGADLDSLVTLGFDDHVKFIVDDGRGEPARRDYTPRHHDAARRELTIDFALHGDGVAVEWARRAEVGQPALIGGPRGSMVGPTDSDWHLLAGDATAVPAMARRLAELPAASRVIVVAQIGDLRPLGLADCRARVELHPVASDEALLRALAGLPLPPGDGYVWCAGEAGVMARVRDLLLNDKQHPRDAMRVAAYWKRGAADYHDDLTR